MKVVVLNYDPNWPIDFDNESKKIRSSFEDLVIKIHHIGSTSVPGLMAKPIIDILLEVSDLAMLDTESEKMENLGYEVMGEYGIPGRRYFRKGRDKRTHHVHAFLLEDPNIKRHLAFRDYLIAHDDIAKAYGELKWKIAHGEADDIGNYSDAKAPFIQEQQAKALKWYENP